MHTITNIAPGVTMIYSNPPNTPLHPCRRCYSVSDDTVSHLQYTSRRVFLHRVISFQLLTTQIEHLEFEGSPDQLAAILNGVRFSISARLKFTCKCTESSETFWSSKTGASTGPTPAFRGLCLALASRTLKTWAYFLHCMFPRGKATTLDMNWNSTTAPDVLIMENAQISVKVFQCRSIPRPFQSQIDIP